MVINGEGEQIRNVLNFNFGSIRRIAEMIGDGKVTGKSYGIRNG